ncbi:hypothetical protein C3Y90_08545 [Rhizobium sp. UPM1134]|nr:hypothetical protein [Rhizobium ruizarguesonis]
MAVAVSAAGAAFQRLAKNRIPGRLATQEQLDELNADMERMADRLADALSALTDASWWLNNENLFTSEDAYELIVGGGSTATQVVPAAAARPPRHPVPERRYIDKQLHTPPKYRPGQSLRRDRTEDLPLQSAQARFRRICVTLRQTAETRK